MRRIESIGLLLLVAGLFGSATSALGEDLFDATVLEDGSLFVQHLNSYHNCCVPISHVVDIVDDVIFIQEIEPYLSGCWCECYFDVDVQITDLAPGAYRIEYTYDVDANLYTEQWLTAVLDIEISIPGGKAGGKDVITTVSECHSGGSVEVRPMAFDRLKSYYR